MGELHRWKAIHLQVYYIYICMLLNIGKSIAWCKIMIVVELSKLLVLGCRYASYAQTIARYRMKQSMGEC